MLSREIKFNDFAGNPRTEEHYFHIGAKQIADMNKNHPGGIIAWLQQVQAGKDQVKALEFLEELIRASHGVRSPDGSKFDRDADITDAFVNSPAYDQLIFELGQSEEATISFIMAVFPQAMADQAQAVMDSKEKPVELPQPDVGPMAPDAMLMIEISGLKNPFGPDGQPVLWWNREPTNEELAAMTRPQLQEAFHRKSSGWTPPAV
jgi:hypothetical protein